MTNSLPGLPEGPSLQSTGSVDPSFQTGLTDIHTLGRQGIEVAEVIAAEETFNKDCAEVSMRNLAGLFNNMTAEDLGSLSPEDEKDLASLALDSADFVFGESAKDELKRSLDTLRPQSGDEAKLTLMRQTFNALQVKVSIGPGRPGGYRQDREQEVRAFTVRYAQTFAKTLFGLNAANRPIATSEDTLKAINSNIRAATPMSLRSYEVPAETGSAEDYTML